MGKYMNQKRKLLFNQLLMEGKLDRPVKIKKRKRKPKPKPKVQVQVKCCKFKYDPLPSWFRACPDCPLKETDA